MKEDDAVVFFNIQRVPSPLGSISAVVLFIENRGKCSALTTFKNFFT